MAKKEKEEPQEDKPKKEKKESQEEKLMKEKDGLKDTLQRLQAEFENYKKRTEKECVDFRKYSNAKLITKMLPILDSFELALKNSQQPEQFRKGIELIYSQFFQTLEDEGLRKIEALKKRFDPYKHEVLLTEESEEDENTILEELQRGYMLNEEVLRHTKVKIAKKPKEEKK